MAQRIGTAVAVASAVSATVLLALFITEGGTIGGEGGAPWIAGAAAVAVAAWAGAWSWSTRRYAIAAPLLLAGAFGSAWLGLAAFVPVALAFVAGYRGVRQTLAAPPGKRR